MNPLPRQPDPNDPLGAYLAGDRDAVRAAGPDEPSEPEWDAIRRAIHARLGSVRAPAPARDRWRTAALVAGGAALAAVAAAAAWVALTPVPVKNDVADARPVPPAPEAPTDPLGDFAVLPMASAEEVELRRVPGSGWLPVGTDPLPERLVLATTDEVELDDPRPAWPQVAPSPGDAPMIFAAKPR